MKCPQCQIDLQMTDRQGIEIDYCPTCRGVWLDRGELDKIIERSTACTGGGPPRDAEDRSREHASDYRNPRRKSLWKELFDFG